MAKARGFSGNRGQILVFVAVAMTGILGITALSIDAAFMYDKRNRLYAAADAAAKSAAIEVRRSSGISTTQLKLFADQQIQAHGFTPVSTNCPSPGAGTLVCVNHPPVSGPFTGNAAAVEVIISERTGTFFGSVLGWFSGNPGARAVAGTAPGPDCLVVFNHVTFSNPAAGNNMTMPNCGMTIGEIPPRAGWTTDLANNATITAKSIGVVHPTGSTGCTGNCGGVVYGVPPPTDPLASLPPPSAPSPTPTCVGQFVISGTVSITSSDVDQYYCGWRFTNNSTLNLLTGGTYGNVFYVNGLISDSATGGNMTINCTACMIYLTAGSGRIQLGGSNSIILNMSADTTGTYNGILFYQDRGATVNNSVILGSNNTTLAVRGAFYFPVGTLKMDNENSNTMTNPCTLIVAYAIEVTKPNFTLDNTCTNFGGSPILSLSLGE